MAKNIAVIHNGEARAGTFLIAQGFDRNHDQVKRLVKKYEKDFLEFGSFHLLKVKSKGRSIEEILLNEDQTMFLGTLFKNSAIVVKFKKKLVREFSKLRKRLAALEVQRQNPRWQVARSASKTLRLRETDRISEFVVYAKEQGSQRANWYYKAFSRMTNDLLFLVEGRFKNLRDVLTPEQLMAIGAADRIIDKALVDGMAKGMYYKDIFRDVKQRVEIFAGLHGKQSVLAEK